MKDFFCVVIAACMIVIAYSQFEMAKTSGGKPVRLYIQDWTTGCEYIQNPNGGITPRIDVDLMHKGCKSLQDGGEQ